MNNKLVYICSPLRGDVESNQEKCRRYCKFACDLGVVPFAPHIFYTQFLSDDVEKEREMGIHCGLEILRRCDEMWVFVTEGYGITSGMKEEINAAKSNDINLKYFYSNGEVIVWKKGPDDE